MDLIKRYMSFKKRYNKRGEILCQAYTDTSAGICNRKATYSVDLNKYLKEYLNINLDFECCMLCSQHSKIILRDLGIYYGQKALKSGMKSIIKAYAGEAYIDYEDVDKIYKGDYRSNKKQMIDNGRGDDSVIFLDFDLTLTDKESKFYDKDFEGFGTLEDLWNSIENYEKLLSILRELKKEGYVLVIVTRSIKGKVERFVNRFFRTTDLEDSEPLFDYVFGSEDPIIISTSSKLKELGKKSNEKNIWSVKKGLFINKYINDLKLLNSYFIDDSKDNIDMCIDLLDDTLCINKKEKDDIVDILNKIYNGEIRPISNYKSETQKHASFDSPPRSFGK